MAERNDEQLLNETEELFARHRELGMRCAASLLAVKRTKAWKAKASSFSGYCERVLRISKGYASRLVYAAELTERLKDAGLEAPTTILECRNLRRLEVSGQDVVEAWRHRDDYILVNDSSNTSLLAGLHRIRNVAQKLAFDGHDVEDILTAVDETIRVAQGDPTEAEVQKRAAELRLKRLGPTSNVAP